MSRKKAIAHYKYPDGRREEVDIVTSDNAVKTKRGTLDDDINFYNKELGKIDKDISQKINEEDFKSEIKKISNNIQSLKEDIFFFHNLPKGYVESGLVAYFDYDLQRKLVKQGKQKKDKWYNIANNTEADIRGFNNINNAYSEQGILLGQEGNREEILVYNNFDMRNEFTFTLKFIPRINDKWSTSNTIFWGFPFGTYTRLKGNELQLNNSSTLSIKINNTKNIVEITYVYKNGFLNIYKNGIKVISNIEVSFDISDRNLHLGQTYESKKYASSLYQVVMVYNRALTDEEVVANSITNKSLNINKAYQENLELRQMLAERSITR